MVSFSFFLSFKVIARLMTDKRYNQAAILSIIPLIIGGWMCISGEPRKDTGSMKFGNSTYSVNWTNFGPIWSRGTLLRKTYTKFVLLPYLRIRLLRVFLYEIIGV
jgi:hypothetical protein